jgi:exosome complex component CSL4
MIEPTATIAIPGQHLGPLTKVQPGPGTHVYNSNLFASILGSIQTIAPPKPAGPSKRLNKITNAPAAPLPIVSIVRPGKTESDKSQKQVKTEVIPEVGSIVLCKVTRITPRQANVAILVVGEWQGLIRVQDVRATEKDRVKIFESFRPGDVVRAVVVSFPLPITYNTGILWLTCVT